ncbi:MAG: hypothetical protein P4M09_03005 [Devosia sp.]|nr:hypothetical protein [Devosia sp.]
MSVFVDSALLQFAQNAFVTDLLTNGLGLTTLFNTAFTATDVEVQSLALGAVTARSYKVPAFESVRSTGVDERILPDMQRVRKERVLPRYGRLDWVDVAFEAELIAKVSSLVGPIESVTIEGLEERLGGVNSIAELRTKLLPLYAPSMVDDLFARLRISSLEDFTRQIHLFVELVGAAPPSFDPEDPAASRSYTVPLRVKIADGFDIAGTLQSAKLCRSILEHEGIPDAPDGVERTVPYTFIVLFDDAAVTDASLPGQTAVQTKAAVQALFNTERMLAQFIT